MDKPAAVQESTLSEIMRRLNIDFEDGVFSAPADPQPIESDSLPELIQRLVNLPAASPVAGVSAEKVYHFSDEQVMGALVGTDHLRIYVQNHLAHMTSGEKFSLYRAIVKLAKEDRNG